MNRGFIDKLIERIRYVQPGDVGHYLQVLSREKGFLETIFNTIREGVIVTDPQDRIIYLNEASCSFFGIGGAENIGRPLGGVIPGPSVLQMPKTVRECLGVTSAGMTGSIKRG